MKRRSLWFMAAVLLILPGTTSILTGQSRHKNGASHNLRRLENSRVVQLFNGHDLSNWVFMLKDRAADPSKVFNVRSGVIHISGDPFGYMRTNETYSDYKLHVEWRWPEEATNSGVFIHAQTPDSIWIKSIECQLQAGNAGDFICMTGTDMNERRDKSTIIVKKMKPSSEKVAGEWNTMEIECKMNTIEVSVNGVLQNRGTGLSVSKGNICLQSEGKDIEFRNVYLTRLSMSNRR